MPGLCHNPIGECGTPCSFVGQEFANRLEYPSMRGSIFSVRREYFVFLRNYGAKRARIQRGIPDNAPKQVGI